MENLYVWKGLDEMDAKMLSILSFEEVEKGQKIQTQHDIEGQVSIIIASFYPWVGMGLVGGMLHTIMENTVPNIPLPYNDKWVCDGDDKVDAQHGIMRKHQAIDR